MNYLAATYLCNVCLTAPFPEGRSVVIDSKVSLTAYTDALAAGNDEERERLIKAA